MDRNNENLKHIARALELSASEIAQIAGVSKSKADAWRRSPTARKSGSGNSTAESVSRYRAMTDAEFDLFCAGLPDWCKSADDDN